MTSLGSESKITADGGVIMLSELGLAEGSFVPLSGRPPLTRREVIPGGWIAQSMPFVVSELKSARVVNRQEMD